VDGTEAPGGIKVSNPSDRFEQAAEKAADQAMAEPSAPVSSVGSGLAGESVQRAPVPGEDEEKKDEEVQALAIQRAAGTDDDLEDQTKAG
jgi:hypothetical protein